jgi:predicted alpha/beta-fold hydrolase
VHRVNQCGWRALVMHFRGCSGEPNRLARSYHSGETGDLQTVVTWLRQREPETPLAAVGYSLGGNVLLKWLGEQGERAPLTAAVAVSVPFQLAGAAERMQQGFSRVYQWVLLRSLRRNALRKFRDWHPPPVDLARVRRMRSFWSFDDGVTAPLHGFADVHDYYRRASSRQFLAAIRVPTLILQARDDPFMTASVIPSAAELSPATTLELSEHGGHVGFVEARPRWRVGYWLERRIPLYLASKLDPGAGLASVGEPGAERLPHA